MCSGGAASAANVSDVFWLTFPWFEGRTRNARVCKRAPCRAMRRGATGCDGMSFNQILSRCRRLSGHAALCRGMSRSAGAAGKWKVPLRGLERDAIIVALLLMTIADRRVVLSLPRSLMSARSAYRAAGSQERETRERRLLNDPRRGGESSQMGGGRSANRRSAGLPIAA